MLQYRTVMQGLDHEKLLNFIIKAQLNTYAGGARYEESPERESFKEMVFSDGDFTYRDSYSGYLRSWGSEVIRFQNKPVLVSSYGGGVEKGQEKMARECFKFLRTALREPDHDKNAPTFRGPGFLRLGDWRYYFEQDGDLTRFEGHEKITFQSKTIFTHIIIGGLVIGRNKI